MPGALGGAGVSGGGTAFTRAMHKARSSRGLRRGGAIRRLWVCSSRRRCSFPQNKKKWWPHALEGQTWHHLKLRKELYRIHLLAGALKRFLDFWIFLQAVASFLTVFTFPQRTRFRGHYRDRGRVRSVLNRKRILPRSVAAQNKGILFRGQTHTQTDRQTLFLCNRTVLTASRL